jgi:hypothetical protein
MLGIVLILFALFIAFACGYGVRELISRQRRAAAREEFLRKLKMERIIRVPDGMRPADLKMSSQSLTHLLMGRSLTN